MHALAFHHEHQNLRGPCEEEFRWEDDPGYVATRDARGVFVPDGQGRRPGIYTYLGGPPNERSRGKVDINLRTAESPDVLTGPFDRGIGHALHLRRILRQERAEPLGLDGMISEAR